MRALALLFALALVSSAGAAPSFDCAKAASAAEREICTDQELQWFDRQLTRLYRVALDQPGADRQTLLAEQRKFLIARETCVGKRLGCIRFLYERRLARLASVVNVFEAYAVYSRKPPGASFWIVRFGVNAGVRIGSVGDDGSNCLLETDNAEVTGKGAVKWHAADGKACRIDIVPDGDNMRVETKNCQDYCGGRAVLDGVFVRQP